MRGSYYETNCCGLQLSSRFRTTGDNSGRWRLEIERQNARADRYAEIATEERIRARARAQVEREVEAEREAAYRLEVEN